MSQTILVVDDDELIRRSLAFHLERAGYRVETAAAAAPALGLARSARPDLVLLDINMPGMDGLQALRHFRDEIGVPVIFVTARRREFDEVLGLELGANDYITKPFDKDVLLARVRAALRTAVAPTLQPVELLRIGDLEINVDARTVAVQGRLVDLSPREFRLLQTLAQQAGRVVTTEALLSQVWGEGFLGEPQVVYVHIRWLRQKLESDPQRPQRILTVRGVGYKLVEPET